MSHPTKLPGKDHGLRHTGEMSRGVIRPVDGCFASVRIEHCSQGQRTSRQVEQSSKFRQGTLRSRSTRRESTFALRKRLEKR